MGLLYLAQPPETLVWQGSHPNGLLPQLRPVCAHPVSHPASTGGESDLSGRGVRTACSSQRLSKKANSKSNMWKVTLRG